MPWCLGCSTVSALCKTNKCPSLYEIGGHYPAYPDCECHLELAPPDLEFKAEDFANHLCFTEVRYCCNCSGTVFTLAKCQDLACLKVFAVCAATMCRCRHEVECETGVLVNCQCHLKHGPPKRMLPREDMDNLSETIGFKRQQLLENNSGCDNNL